MKKERKSIKHKNELNALTALPDQDIDTNDIPETADWRDAERGRFYRSVKKPVSLRIDVDVLAGNRTTLALVRRLGSEATLMLIRGKKKLGEAALNIPEQLSSLRFLTETTLFFETQQRFGTFTVAPPQLGTSLLQLGPISELPRTLTVNLPNGPVSTNFLDWSCMIQ